MKRATLLLAFFCYAPLSASFWESLFPERTAYGSYKTKDFSSAQKILEEQQIDNPNDPLINYNLGTTYFRQDKFDLAKDCFRRASTNSFGKNNELQEKALFNLGNSLHKSGVSKLPPDWEKQEKLDEKLVSSVISELQEAVKSYQDAIKLKPSKRTETNKKITEDIIQKLTKQQQNNDDQNKDKDKKQDKQDQKQNKQDKQKNDQNKNEQNKQDKQKDDQNKNQNKNKKDDSQQDKQKEKQDKKQNNQNKKEEEQKKENQQPVSMEQRKMEAELAKLDDYGKQGQKYLLKKRTEKDAKPQNSYQKPW
jgi:Ca-activated chloride channel homolog